MSARAPLIYDDLVETIQEGVERVRDAYAATGNSVLMAAAMWRDDLHDLIDEVVSAEPDDVNAA